ncbi:MAG: sigma-70 family RNA polymerase sigma factor [Acidobacteriota bacterium]
MQSQTAISVEGAGGVVMGPSPGDPWGSDEEQGLLSGLAAGDTVAAERLVEVTYRGVYASLHRLCGGDAELAADLTQDTYRKAWTALASFRGDARLSTWLYRIAYTTFLNHVRRPLRLVPMPDGIEGDASHEPSPDQEAAAADASERLRRAVLALPDDLRFTITAHYWGELSVADIAKQESLTPVAIRKRLARAVALLGEALGERGAQGRQS